MIGRFHAAGAARTLLLAALLTGVVSAAHATVTISKKPTKSVSCTAGVCTPTKAKANLNVTDLANLLAAGDVKVVADSKAADIEITDAIGWASPSRLTLDSYHSISFDAPVTVAGTGAGFTITTNDGGSGGDYAFAKKGHVMFWDAGSSLVINAKNYTLVRSIDDLAKKILHRASGRYALADTYDASKDGTYAQTPIATIFEGAVDGLGNSIENLSIVSQDANSVGLFGLVDVAGAIRNLSLVHAQVQAPKPSPGRSVGALVAINYGSLTNDAVSGEVRGSEDTNSTDKVGGLVGTDYGLVARCRSNVRVADATISGGLVGGLEELGYGAEVADSSATGKVSSDSVAGGLVGATGGAIVNSFATAAVDTLSAPSYMESQVGGLVGVNDGSITNSYADATTVAGGGSTEMGGLVGENQHSITNSYATGTVSSVVCGDCGGLVGSNSGVLNAVYSSVLVDVPAGLLGGLIGIDNAEHGSLTNTYWDLDTSGITDPQRGAGYPLDDSGITGLTDAQLKSGLPSGFDPAVWGQAPNINSGFPYLLANPPPK